MERRRRRLVLSQYVEVAYARELLADSAEGVGYLLKDRVADVATLTTRYTGSAPAARCSIPKSSPRCSAAIAAELVVTDRAVEKHVTGVFSKLELTSSSEDHQRVLAVLRFLDGPGES